MDGYGYMQQVGDNFYANHGCTILDCNYIRIGKNCLLAPHVCISAAPIRSIPPFVPVVPSSLHPLPLEIMLGLEPMLRFVQVLPWEIMWWLEQVLLSPRIFQINVVIGGVPAKIIKKISKLE